MRYKINFSFIGGAHHFWHLAPIAAALSHDPEIIVQAFVNNAESQHQLSNMLTTLGASTASIAIVEMTLPSAFASIADSVSKWGELKVPRLLWWNKELRRCDALVTAERTSTLLSQIPGRNPLMIHVPHGAGDRAQGFEKRIARFDCVIVAGEKDRQRMISSNLVNQDNCFVSGYVKLSTLLRLHADKWPKLFSNDRPVIVYNAHFDPTLSSWPAFAHDVIDRISLDGRYNLIVAPHVRLFETATTDEKARWTNLAVEDRVIIDLGSQRSTDMSYTMAADIYLGDVSSQIYEFVAEPRPCIFIDAHHARWRDNPDYRMWELGDVIEDIDQLLPSVEQCPVRHKLYRDTQVEFTRTALGDVNADAAANAAQIIKQNCLRPMQPSAA